MRILALFVLFVATGACGNPTKIDCIDAANFSYRTGVCEGVGTVVIPENGTAQHVVLDDGTYAVVDLPLSLNAMHGDRVRITAKYYLGEKHIDLAEHESVEIIRD